MNPILYQNTNVLNSERYPQRLGGLGTGSIARSIEAALLSESSASTAAAAPSRHRQEFAAIQAGDVEATPQASPHRSSPVALQHPAAQQLAEPNPSQSPDEPPPANASVPFDEPATQPDGDVGIIISSITYDGGVIRPAGGQTVTVLGSFGSPVRRTAPRARRRQQQQRQQLHPTQWT